MPLWVAEPAHVPAPAVLIVNDMYGMSPFHHHIMALIAALGFVAIDADYFHRSSLLTGATFEGALQRRDALDRGQAVADLSELVRHLQSDSRVAPGTVGAIGFCIGGTLAVALAAEEDVVGISFYGFPVEPPEGSGDATIDLRKLASRIRRPILAHWAGADQYIDGPLVASFETSLHEANVPAEFLFYDDMKHGFMSGLLSSEPSAEKAAASQAWSCTTAFLSDHLHSDKQEAI
jgi:carboxymethylenebutenolidase